MRKKVSKRFIAVAALLLAIIVAGCQAIGGLDLNEMLLKNIEVTSGEESQKLEIELAFNDSAFTDMTPEEAELMKSYFSKITLEIDHSKSSAGGEIWLTGAVGFGERKIPFTIHGDASAFRIDVEGAKRPFVLDLSAAGMSLGELMPFGSGSALSESNEKALTDYALKLVRNVGSYFVNGLPNPPVISVDRVSETINGSAVDLTKVHAELNGEQLGELVGVYLDNLIADQEGLRAMLRNFAQWINEMPPELMEQIEEAAMFELETELFEDEAAIDEFVQEVFDELYPLLEEARQGLAEAKEDESWNEIFDSGISLVTDLYVDDSLHVRKNNVELTIAPAFFATEESPFSSITIRSSGERWNVNGDVTIPPVEIPRNALQFEDFERMEGYRFLRTLDSNSLLYDMLKNDLEIDDQSFTISGEWGVPYLVDEDGVVFLPVRATAEGFGISLKAPAAKGQIAFYDGATNQTFEFNVGSTTALVNGQQVQLEYAPFSDGYTYMAADDLLGLLKAEYELYEIDYGAEFAEEFGSDDEYYDEYYDDMVETYVEITRDL